MRSHLCRMLIVFFLSLATSVAAYAGNAEDSLRNSIAKSCLGKVVDKEKCLMVGQDFTIMKSLSSHFHYLFVPVNAISGIESAEFWTPGYPAWFQMAWRFRHIAAPWLGNGVAPEKLGIAINSQPRRTQNQLHIHINCIRKDILDEINAAQLSNTWLPLTLNAAGGHAYQAIKLPGSNIPDDLLTTLYHSARVNKDPGDITLFAALSETGKAIVLQGKYDPENHTTGSAQDLLTACP